MPAPLGPTIRVKGLKKVMTFLFSGSKLRIPFINILSTVLIFFSCLSNSGLCSLTMEQNHESWKKGFMQKWLLILVGMFKQMRKRLEIHQSESESWLG